MAAHLVTLLRHYLPDGTGISALGLGCSSYWAKPSFPEDQAVDLVLRAYELGINHFDSGPSYAAGGAEKRLGKALRHIERGRVVVTTKAGTYVDSGGKQFKSFEPARIRAGLQESLQRLGTTHVDILYLHGPRPLDLCARVLDCLSELKASGLVHYTGVNSFDPAVLRKLVGLPIDAVMPQYSIFDISCAREIDALRMDGKLIVSGTALGQGLVDIRSLFPRSKKSLWYLLRALKNDPMLPATLMKARRRIAELGVPTLEAALLFLLKTPGITSSIFGTTSVGHLEANVAALTRVADVMQHREPAPPRNQTPRTNEPE